MANEKLTNLVSELISNRKDASISIEGLDPSTASGWVMRKNQAIAKIKEIEAAYYNELDNTIFYIFLTGNSAKCREFAGLSLEHAQVSSLVGNTPALLMTDQIEPTIGPDRNFGVNQLIKLIGLISNLERDLEVKKSIFESVPGDYIRYTPTKNDVYNVIAHFINTNLPVEFMTTFLKKQARDLAINSAFDGNVLPLTVTGLNEPEVNKISSAIKNSFIVSLTDETIDKSLVLNTLKKIKTNILLTKKNN